jgi:hypothetical protein
MTLIGFPPMGRLDLNQFCSETTNAMKGEMPRNNSKQIRISLPIASV